MCKDSRCVHSRFSFGRSRFLAAAAAAVKAEDSDGDEDEDFVPAVAAAADSEEVKKKLGMVNRRNSNPCHDYSHPVT